MHTQPHHRVFGNSSLMVVSGLNGLGKFWGSEIATGEKQTFTIEHGLDVNCTGAMVSIRVWNVRERYLRI
ncbi:MAG: hypothetical protein OEV30_13615, partial [Ignavibacteria bacterium]|nr:hypothetical protein [Ignavibacteria bacterium]